MYIFTFLLVGVIIYFGFKCFNLIPTFLFEKTSKTEGTVTNIRWIYGKNGSYVQSVTYQYQVVDSVYTDKFMAERKHMRRKIGDRLFLKYSVKDPNRNEIIGNCKKALFSNLGDEAIEPSRVNNQAQ